MRKGRAYMAKIADDCAQHFAGGPTLGVYSGSKSAKEIALLFVQPFSRCSYCPLRKIPKRVLPVILHSREGWGLRQILAVDVDSSEREAECWNGKA